MRCSLDELAGGDLSVTGLLTRCGRSPGKNRHVQRSTWSVEQLQGGALVRMANLLSGIVLLVFGVALLFWVIPWQVEESFGGEVSPRLLPQICAIGIAVLSIVLNQVDGLCIRAVCPCCVSVLCIRAVYMCCD